MTSSRLSNGGLAYFDSDHNTAIILGMNYFGELKKATLTLAWGIAHRLGYVACHDGQNKFTLSNEKNTCRPFLVYQVLVNQH